MVIKYRYDETYEFDHTSTYTYEPPTKYVINITRDNKLLIIQPFFYQFNKQPLDVIILFDYYWIVHSNSKRNFAQTVFGHHETTDVDLLDSSGVGQRPK